VRELPAYPPPQRGSEDCLDDRSLLSLHGEMKKLHINSGVSSFINRLFAHKKKSEHHKAKHHQAEEITLIKTPKSTPATMRWI
jgi:hypothetical protein